MNRKERRAAGKAQEKKTEFKPATAAAASKANTLKTEGMALRAAGKEAESIPLLTEALILNSAFADVHFLLAIMARTKPELSIDMTAINRDIKNKLELKAAYKTIQDILRERKQRAENLICQEEICRLLPDDNDEKAEYALMLNLANRRYEGLKILVQLLNSHPDNKIYKGIFSGLINQVNLTHHEPEIKKALQNCFDNIYESNLSKALPLWTNIITHDPDCSGLKNIELKKSYEDFEKWLNNAPPEELAFSQDRFFLSGLRLLIISGVALEKIICRLRRGLCLNIENLSQVNRIEIFESLIYALGEQSFFNEYIYFQPDDEKAVVENLIEKIKTDKLENIKPQHAYGMISCYQMLHTVFPEKKDDLQALADKSDDFAKLFKTQFLDIEEENALKLSLPSFGMLENEISKNVQAQYEENPYPRWVSCVNYPTPTSLIPFDEKYRRHHWKILVAGCGTGHHALSTAAMYPHAHVTAIDISRSSLAYAQRKANESGLADRIDFIHADILSMDQWPEQFDIIESSGVLHHMEDPFKGWQILCSKLKPGGYFKVGLYSEAARREVIKARDHIKEMGFEPTLESMRICREDIINRAPSDHLRQWMLNSTDFYTTSALRDLIFHVQEHRMTLPQIQAMLDRLDLVCIKFVVADTSTALKYDSQFPNDPARKNLNHWHEFEKNNPNTFNNMYQFWSQKR